MLRATEKNGGRNVVLKAVQRRADDPDAEVRFRSTMDAHSHLDHPHLIPVLRFGATDSLLWFAMQDHGANSLRAQLRDQQRLDARAARRVATQLVSALEYLHRRGIVHGAVKPENVLVDAQGWVRLVEPAFASTSAERTPAGDQAALAAVIFECVAGEPPLEPGEKVARFRPEVPLAMSQAIARALDAQPARRFANCTDFLFALEQNAPAAPVAEHRPSGRMSTEALLIHDWEPPEAAVRSKTKPVKLIIGIAIGVALALASPFVVRKFQEARAPQSVASSPMPAMLPSGSKSQPSPSAVRVTGDVAAPVDPAPSSTRQVAPPAARRTPTPSAPQSPTSQRATPQSPASQPAARPPVAPSSIPRASATPTPAADGAVGKLTVNASPWGQVFVDDRLIGNTPRANIELPAGAHTLRVSRQGFETVTRSVQIKVGETLRITDIVLTPIAP